jgi:hypothetical protein
MTRSNADLLSLARELPIPVPWDREVFIQNFAEMRGRPITLVPIETATMPDSPCGLWLACDDDDLILHQTGTSDYHIDQIVRHEIGHIVLGHGRRGGAGGDKVRARELCREVLPDIDPEAVWALLGRTDYSSGREREAETFASILMLAAAEVADQRSMFRSVFFRR